MRAPAERSSVLQHAEPVLVQQVAIDSWRSRVSLRLHPSFPRGCGANEMSDEPQATVREVDGQLVVDDPQALAVWSAIGRVNLYNADPAAVKRLELRAKEKGD